MSNAPRSEIDRLREELKADRPDLADWEASCLESVADLLEQLESARRRWDAMAGELAEREEEIAALREERVQAEASARAAERVAADLARTRAELETLRRERAALAAADTELHVVRAELSRERERGEAARAEAEEELARARASIEELGARVELLTGERDVLAEAGRAHGAKDAALALARQRLGELEQQVGQHLVEVCDLRARIVRLEAERDEAARGAARKTKRILEKVHDELDDAGAPRGEEASFGERIRYLKQRIRDLERRG